MSELDKSSAALPTSDLEIILKSEEGESVDNTKLDTALRKLSTPALQEYVDNHTSHMTAQQEGEQLQNDLAAGTSWGAFKRDVGNVAGSVGMGALKSTAYVGQKADSVSGAPTRSALYEVVKDPTNIGGAINSFGRHFGRHYDEVPSGKTIAIEMGFSPKDQEWSLPDISNTMGESIKVNFSPAGAVGLAIDVGADYTNILPLSWIAKKFAQGVGYGMAKGAQLAVKGSAAAVDAASGTNYAGKVVELADGTIKNAVSVLKEKMSPGLSPNAEEMKAIANKLGIAEEKLPAQIIHGKSSLITQMEKTAAEGPLGEQRLKNHEDLIMETNNGINNKLREAAGGSLLTPQEAGNVIREGYNEAADRTFKSILNSYDSVIEELPKGQRISIPAVVPPESWQSFNGKLNEIAKEARDIMDKAVKEERYDAAEKILMATRNVRAQKGDYASLLSQLREVGSNKADKIFQTANESDKIFPEKKLMRDLYFTLQAPILDATAAIKGEKFAFDLVNKNRVITDFFKDNKAIASIITNDKIAPETLFKQLVRSGDSTKIEALRGILTPDQMNQMKGTFLDDLIKTNIAGEISFKKLHNTFSSNKNMVNTLFQDNPQVVNDILDYARFGDALGLPYMSTSRTGSSLAFKNIIESVPQAISNEVVLESLKKSARGEKVFQNYNTSLGRTPLGKVMKGAAVVGAQSQSEDNPIRRAIFNNSR